MIIHEQCHGVIRNEPFVEHHEADKDDHYHYDIKRIQPCCTAPHDLLHLSPPMSNRAPEKKMESTEPIKLRVSIFANELLVWEARVNLVSLYVRSAVCPSVT